MNGLDRAQRIFRQPRTERGEVWIEATVEPDQDPRAQRIQRLGGGTCAGQVEVDGLFTEDGMAFARGADHQVDMRRRRAGDDDPGYARHRQGGIDIDRWHAMMAGQPPRRIRRGVIDAGQRQSGVGSDRFRMNRPDPPRSDQCDVMHAHTQKKPLPSSIAEGLSTSPRWNRAL